MIQSREDLRGGSHANGWGVATYEDHFPRVDRQAWAAYHGEHFQRAAAKIFSHQVLAHVRRATVGEPRISNTHPFVDGRWSFIHNGTVPHFDKVRPKFQAALPRGRREAILGDTDSEHIFHYLRHLQGSQPERSSTDILRLGLNQIVEWCREIDPSAEVGLNVIMTDGEQMFGSRFGRTLYCVERRGVHDCEICGFPHVHHDPNKTHLAVVVASEPISHENWREIPESSAYLVTKHFDLEIAPL
jgi:predicted glutamine amidotransferase